MKFSTVFIFFFVIVILNLNLWLNYPQFVKRYKQARWRKKIKATKRDENNCKSCLHSDFYQMLTKGAYGYYGDIPCLSCCHYIKPKDNFEPIERKELK